MTIKFDELDRVWFSSDTPDMKIREGTDESVCSCSDCQSALEAAVGLNFSEVPSSERR